MKLVPLKCTSCSGELSRVSSDTVLCNYCSTAYLLVEGSESRVNAARADDDAIELPVELTEEEYTPCEREMEVRRRLTDAEYQFWQSVPARPEVGRNRRGRIEIESGKYFELPIALVVLAISFGLLSFKFRSLWAVAICFALPGVVLGLQRLPRFMRAKRLVTGFVRNQANLWKEIRNIRGELELQHRLP